MTTNPRCPDYDFLYATWVMACKISENDAREAKAALMAHAANCPVCERIAKEAYKSSKPLPEVEVSNVQN